MSAGRKMRSTCMHHKYSIASQLYVRKLYNLVTPSKSSSGRKSSPSAGRTVRSACTCTHHKYLMPSSRHTVQPYLDNHLGEGNHLCLQKESHQVHGDVCTTSTCTTCPALGKQFNHTSIIIFCWEIACVCRKIDMKYTSQA